MPKILKIFRKAGSSEKKHSVFRRKDASNKRSKNTGVPVEQSLTWTLSEDSSVVTEPAVVQDIQPLLEETKMGSPAKEGTFVFTEKELMQNELNHMNALSKLEGKIAELEVVKEQLMSQHEEAIAKKDDDYVELLIKFEEKENELAIVRAELVDAKEELKVVSCQLIRTQHEQFEEKEEKNLWMSLFSSSFATF